LSLPRSGRGANRPTGRTAPARGGRPGVFVQAPRSDVYVAMLGVALGAMLLGCLLLLLKLNEYGFELKATAVTPAAGAVLAEFSENPHTVRL
jgi:hypothetical protein